MIKYIIDLLLNEGEIMKLKFKARPQDWLIFVLFAIILLYIVAIAVLNIATLAGNPPIGSELKSGNFGDLILFLLLHLSI